MEDSKIITLFLERSEQAIAELSAKYGQLCRRVAENILGDPLDAEECVNDAYLATWNTIPPQQPEVLPSYLCRIVRNLALKKYHHNTAQKRNSAYDLALEELTHCLPAATTVEEEMEAREVAGIINGFLEDLDPQSRIMFVRRYWHGDTVGEIAEFFQVSRHFVSVRLSRVRKALKKHLISQGVTI